MTNDARTRRRRLACAAVAMMLVAPTGEPAARAPDISSQLQRQTQELLDAIAVGNRVPWTRYLDDGVVYGAEDGQTRSKAELLEEIRPFPKDVWGRLRVTRFRCVVHGNTAITNYVVEEEQGYFGQVVHARYSTTDTWLNTGKDWRLIASQVLALRDDPPAVTLPPSVLDEYVGVYSLTAEITYTIQREGGGLTGQRTGRKPEALRAELRDSLFVPGQPRLRKIFQRDATGRVIGFVERRESWDITWRRVQ